MRGATGARRLDASFVLLVLLLILQTAVEVAYCRHPLITDEVYWIRKAQYIAEHHRFEPAAPSSLATERGQRWGTSDWRPQGYPTVVAIVSGGDFTDPAGVLRRRLTLVMCIGMSIVIAALYLIAARFLDRRHRLYAAAMFGLAPWPFENVNEIGTDTLNAIITTAALLLLWRWCIDRRYGAGAVFAASLVAAVPLLFRPEMIVIGPLVVAASMIVRRPTRSELLAMVLAVGTVAGVQLAYRTWFTGHLGFYGGLHIENRGAFDWANTWLGTEKEGYDFVYAISDGHAAPPVPSRAFANESERTRVEAIVTRVAQRGHYTAADDAEFEQLAHERIHRMPIRTSLLHLWHATHNWINIENPSPLLDLLAKLSRAVRRPILGALVLLRLLILTLAALATIRTYRAFRARAVGDVAALTFLALSLIVSRSLLIGVVLNWKVHRYMLAAWPAMLWCALAGLIWLSNREARADGDSDSVERERDRGIARPFRKAWR